MEKMPIIPKDQYVCHSHAAQNLMTFTEECHPDIVQKIYQRARDNNSMGLYYNLVNTLLYTVMNKWVDMQDQRGIEADLIREMSIADQEEFVRVYENRYNLWLQGKPLH